MSRPTQDPPDEDEELLSRLVSEAGDPKVEPRPEHVADLRALMLDRLDPRRADRLSKTRWLLVPGLAAACLLAVLAWPRGDGDGPVPGPSGRQSSVEIAPRPQPESAGIAAWRNVRRDLDVSEMPTFSWPLQESSPLTVMTSIPPDLFD